MNTKLRQTQTVDFIKILLLKSSLMVALLLPICLKADTVTLTDSGNGTVTMANNEVSMTFSKSDGSVSSFYVAGLPTTKLIDSSQDYALSLTHIGSGTNGTYYVLTSTNLAAPLTNWTRLLTNQFDGGVNFNLTNAMNTNSPQSFYLLQMP
jgi:hypothetical protein